MSKQTPVYPRHPRHLVGSHWTRTDQEPLGAPFLHYEVTVYRAQQKSVRLRAVLSPVDEIELPWRALRDRNCWTPGWSSVVENEP